MKKLFVLLVPMLFLLAACASKYPQEEVDRFAKCLTENKVVMYGTFWCPKCAKQKKMFGTSFQYIQYIECDPRGENEQSELCIEKKVEKYPDWEFIDESRMVGILSFEELSEKSGCPAPVKEE
ncbi:MAG: hypothetical protein ISS25_03770 [Nanoarchaeota archaeon]|nr:hypothetical protein [DPANN group archaeon]MBL7116921.1 hypothetical protein [Nanoarchaeota archaeon]